MTTVTQPRTYVKPGSPDSVVPVQPRYENFIDGRWVPPLNGEYTTNLSPATGRPSPRCRARRRKISKSRSMPPMPPKMHGEKQHPQSGHVS